MLSNVSKFYIYVILLSLGSFTYSMNPSEYLAGLPSFFIRNGLRLPPLHQLHQQPAQQPLADQPINPIAQNIEQQSVTRSKERRKRHTKNREKKAEKPQKHQKQAINVIFEEALEDASHATNLSTQDSSSLSSTSTSSSLLSSGPSAFRPYSSTNNQQTQAQEPVVLHLRQITHQHLVNLRIDFANRTHFVIVSHPGNQKQFNQDLIKLLALYFPRITHLDISGIRISTNNNAAFNALMNYFKHITSLNASGIQLSIEDLAKQWSCMPLKELNLTRHRITSRALEALASCPLGSQLERLNLSDAQPTLSSTPDRFNSLTETISNAGRFPKLRSLDLAGWQIAEPAIQQLINASFIENLEYLNIDDTELSSTALEALTNKAKHLRQLAFTIKDERVLDKLNLSLRTNGFLHLQLEALAITGDITEIGMQSIILSCPALRRLRITGNITQEAARALAQSILAKQLEVLELNVDTQQINPQPVGTLLAQILESHNFARLVELSIRNQNIGNEGILWLASARFAPNLRVLDLAGNSLTSQGWDFLAHPANPAAFSQLQELYLSYNRHTTIPQADPVITQSALTEIETLIDNPVFMHTLRRLDLTETKIINEYDINKLARLTFPNLRELSIQHQSLKEHSTKWLELLGSASFARQLTTLALDEIRFVSKNDRNDVLQNYFTELRSLTLKNQDRVMKPN